MSKNVAEYISKNVCETDKFRKCKRKESGGKVRAPTGVFRDTTDET